MQQAYRPNIGLTRTGVSPCLFHTMVHTHWTLVKHIYFIFFAASAATATTVEAAAAVCNIFRVPGFKPEILQPQIGVLQ